MVGVMATAPAKNKTQYENLPLFATIMLYFFDHLRWSFLHETAQFAALLIATGAIYWVDESGALIVAKDALFVDVESSRAKSVIKFLRLDFGHAARRAQIDNLPNHLRKFVEYKVAVGPNLGTI
jgi:hypothetical protein